ncbi:hypothetical protein NKG05_07635 [Oerskovia sp. M15]
MGRDRRDRLDRGHPGPDPRGPRGPARAHPVVEEAEDTVEALPDDGFDDSDSAIGYAPGSWTCPHTPRHPPAPDPATRTSAP